MTESQQREAVVAEALTWLNTPYHHLARVKGAGVDCATILAEIYPKIIGVNEVELPFYPHDWHLHRDQELYLELVEQYAHEITEAQAKPGDLVVFKFGRTFSHGAILVNWPTVVHAYLQARAVVLENVLQNKEIARRIRRFYSPWV